MKKVILTGANGFVGHHILEHFLKKQIGKYTA